MTIRSASSHTNQSAAKSALLSSTLILLLKIGISTGRPERRPNSNRNRATFAQAKCRPSQTASISSWDKTRGTYL